MRMTDSKHTKSDNLINNCISDSELLRKELTDPKAPRDSRMSWKLWLGIFLGIAAAGFLGIVVLVVYVDPFFQYHKPLSDFPYLVDNQLSQNPGMAKNFDYDSVLLGSSMTVNFNTDWFEELYGEKTAKLSYNGAYPKDQANIMEIIFRTHPDLKKVYLGVDIPAYSSDVDTTKYPIPAYLYDDHYFNDISYVLNKDVLLNYILRPLADPEDKTDFGTMYALWWTDEYFNKQYVLQYYEAPEIVETEVPTDAYISSLEENLAVNICPYIEAYPDTEFVIFYPPYSILYWYGVMRENKLEATLAEYAYTANCLLAYDNVRFYNFLDREEIITNLDGNYADYDHYHRDINRYMAECFGTGVCEIVRDDDAKENAKEDTRERTQENVKENVKENTEENAEKKMDQISELDVGENFGKNVGEKAVTVTETIERMRKLATTYDYDTIFNS